MSEFIICYDIADAKRLGRLYRLLKKYSLPLQYSVFFFSGDERQLDRLLGEAAHCIDPKVDDLRAYPLPARGLKIRLGKPLFPEGIHFGGLPVAW